MATVTLVGKVKLPDGTIPGGALEFMALNKIESAGAVKARVPGAASIAAADGAVSAALEAGEQYDVEAVLTGRYAGRYSLGRWTAPGGGVFTAPALFDAWRTTLPAPDDVLRLVGEFRGGSLGKTPKRGALDIWTFAGGPATYGANGVLVGNGQSLSIPSVDNLAAAMGTIAFTFAPDGWSGGCSVQHYLVGNPNAGANEIHLRYHVGDYVEWTIVDGAGGTRRAVVTDVSGFQAGVVVKVGARWNAGVLKLRVNAVDQSVQDGAGTGILSALSTPLYLGADESVPTDEANGYFGAVRIWERDLSDSELTAALAAL